MGREVCSLFSQILTKRFLHSDENIGLEDMIILGISSERHMWIRCVCDAETGLEIFWRDMKEMIDIVKCHPRLERIHVIDRHRSSRAQYMHKADSLGSDHSVQSHPMAITPKQDHDKHYHHDDTTGQVPL